MFLQDSHKCFLHGRTCRREQQRPDVSSGGFECQAYSHMRSRMGKTERTRSTAEHPLFAAPLKHFLAYIALRLPYCFWLEEVKGFTVPLDALGGVSPATYVAKKLEALGYACECLILDHCLWARSKRERVWLFGCHTDCGGREGTEIIKQIILSAVVELQFLNKLSRIPGAWDIVDKNGKDEVAMCRSSEDLSNVQTIVCGHANIFKPCQQLCVDTQPFSNCANNCLWTCKHFKPCKQVCVDTQTFSNCANNCL